MNKSKRIESIFDYVINRMLTAEQKNQKFWRQKVEYIMQNYAF